LASSQLAQDPRQLVHKPQRISDHRRKLFSHRKPPFGLRENRHPTVRAGSGHHHD
jgi:hypothetical protein